MSYIQIEFCSNANDVEIISDVLESLGALGITWVDAEDSPIYEPLPNTYPLWEQVIVTALFSLESNIKEIKTILQNKIGMIDISESVVDDENWVEKNLQDFKPIAIANSFWICPSWHEVEQKNAKVLKLNPGLAFGTGEHPTTQMILKYLIAQPKQHNTVLDYGCGSGILALSACILGAKHVYAVDIDPQALIATHNNAELNHIDQNKITISLPDALINIQVDQLLANIFMIPLLTLHKKFAGLLKPQGEILLSGILASQSDDIFKTYAEDFDLNIVNEQDQWLLVRGIKKNI